MAPMQLLTVNQELCAKCGLCAAVCPRGLIQLLPGPTENHVELCIACGQCVAVCPVKAIDNVRAPLAGQIGLEPGGALGTTDVRQYLRARRSVRVYQKKPVPREKLRDLMDIARFAPSGGNSQGISYCVVDRPETMRSLTEQTIAWMEEAERQETPAAKTYAQYVEMYRKYGRDSILRGAPALVLGLADINFARGRENTLLTLAYADLYAPSIGLGTCWAGLLEAAAFSGFAPLMERLQIPGGKKLTGALMVGYPKFGFKRLPDRNPLEITFQGD
jgi:nitroreductase/NAD-dependent dihydropyrimidine dehydrogenase PreA subunit